MWCQVWSMCPHIGGYFSDRTFFASDKQFLLYLLPQLSFNNVNCTLTKRPLGCCEERKTLREVIMHPTEPCWE